MDTDSQEDLIATVQRALAEDIGTGDITAQLIDPETQGTAEVITRQPAVICGQAWVNEVFRQVDPEIDVAWEVSEGDEVHESQCVFFATGAARTILTAERTALNFLQTLSATATRTRRYAELIKHTRATLLDTRKTIPGLRLAQKYAVSVGGGANHRIGLFDAFLIKENHIIAAGSIGDAIARARALYPDRRVEVEVENMDEFRQAINAEPDWIMLDNFSIAELKAAVAATNTNIKLEVSGGIESDQDLTAIAEAGVDFISLGALTKHISAIDLSMRFV